MSCLTAAAGNTTREMPAQQQTPRHVRHASLQEYRTPFLKVPLGSRPGTGQGSLHLDEKSVADPVKLCLVGDGLAERFGL